MDFIININGNVYQKGKEVENLFTRLGNAAFKLNNILQATSTILGGVCSAMQGFEEAYKQQATVETKLQQVMQNTMDARQKDIDAIKRLASAQQQLGVIGDEVQLAGAQELSTYLTKRQSLEKLMPVMNDMLAQQYGLNATQESAVGIATMMGKVMDGQVNALSRYGYKFTEAQERILKYGTEAQRAATLAEVVSEAVGGMNTALAATPEGKMQQLSNRIGDIKERVGSLYTNIRVALLPVFDNLSGALENAVGWVEDHREKIEEIFVKIGESMGKVASVFANNIYPIITEVVSKTIAGIKWLNATINNTIDFIGKWKAVLIPLTVAIGAFTVACNTQRIVLLGYAIAIKAITIWQAIATKATELWSAAQAVLNAVLTANPIGLIIAGVAALIALIIFLCKKITGWGSLWDGVCGIMKYSFLAFVDVVKLAFDAVVNGIMIGLDKIKLGWYKFKEACGIGDSSENQAAIAQINADVERRQQAIIDGAKKVKENTEKAVQSWQGIQMGWDKSEKKEKMLSVGASASLGTNDALKAAVSGSNSSGSESGNNSQMAKSTETVATGGKRSMNINISLKDLVGVMNFNGTLQEKKEDMERVVAEAMFRVLAMAQSSVS